MAMNRRNVLVGLGAVAVGGGAAFGSGAFSQVEAERSVSVDTAGDASGFLQLSGNGEYVTQDGGSGVLTIDLGQVSGGSGFNREARTVVEDVVTATNNAADSENIDLGFDNGSGSLTASQVLELEDADGNQAKVTIYFGTEDNQAVVRGLGSSSSASIGAIVDTRSESNGGGGDGDSADVTVLAVDSDGS